jgi:hypothetical protein
MMNLAMAFVDDLECYTHVTCKQAIVVKQNSALPISRNVLRNVEYNLWEDPEQGEQHH